MKAPVCPKKHETSLFVADADDWSCSKCGQRLQLGTTMCSCRRCNFDICNNCRLDGGWVLSEPQPNQRNSAAEATKLNALKQLGQEDCAGKHFPDIVGKLGKQIQHKMSSSRSHGSSVEQQLRNLRLFVDDSAWSMAVNISRKKTLLPMFDSLAALVKADYNAAFSSMPDHNDESSGWFWILHTSPPHIGEQSSEDFSFYSFTSGLDEELFIEHLSHTWKNSLIAFGRLGVEEAIVQPLGMGESLRYLSERDEAYTDKVKMKQLRRKIADAALLAVLKLCWGRATAVRKREPFTGKGGPQIPGCRFLGTEFDTCDGLLTIFNGKPKVAIAEIPPGGEVLICPLALDDAGYFYWRDERRTRGYDRTRPSSRFRARVNCVLVQREAGARGITWHFFNCERGAVDDLGPKRVRVCLPCERDFDFEDFAVFLEALEACKARCDEFDELVTLHVSDCLQCAHDVALRRARGSKKADSMAKVGLLNATNRRLVGGEWFLNGPRRSIDEEIHRRSASMARSSLLVNAAVNEVVRRPAELVLRVEGLGGQVIRISDGNALPIGTGDTIYEDIAARGGLFNDQEARHIQECFKTYDSNGDGFINAEEFALLLKDLGASMSIHDVRRLISAADKNSDGRMDRDEFLSWVMSQEYIT